MYFTLYQISTACDECGILREHIEEETILDLWKRDFLAAIQPSTPY